MSFWFGEWGVAFPCTCGERSVRCVEDNCDCGERCTTFVILLVLTA